MIKRFHCFGAPGKAVLVWQQDISGQNHSPHEPGNKEKEKGAGVPQTPSRVHPNSQKTSLYAPPLNGSKSATLRTKPLMHGPLGKILDSIYSK